GLQDERITNRGRHVDLDRASRRLQAETDCVRSALRDEAYVARFTRTQARVVEQPQSRVAQAHAVGADHRHVRARGDLFHFGFEFHSDRIAGFGKTGGEVSKPGDPGRGAVGQDLRCEL